VVTRRGHKTIIDEPRGRAWTILSKASRTSPSPGAKIAPRMLFSGWRGLKTRDRFGCGGALSEELVAGHTRPTRPVHKATYVLTCLHPKNMHVLGSMENPQPRTKHPTMLTIFCQPARYPDSSSGPGHSASFGTVTPMYER
jgi:hypothetical protein